MKKNAFTMAEILLSLTIIGVVAAITLPSLMGNINERTWNTQRRALYARLSQAIGMMPQLSGYGSQVAGEDGSLASDTAAEAFVTEGLSKVIKINNICDSAHLEDCGLSTTVTDLQGSTAYSSIPNTLGTFNGSQFVETLAGVNPQTKAAAFETQNGESVLLYYNPKCVGSRDNINPYTAKNMCANFVYDLNGNKGPNTVGKDIGVITAFYPVDSLVVAPDIVTSAVTSSGIDGATASAYCSSNYDGTRLANVEEAMSLSVNVKLLSVYELNSPVLTATAAGFNSEGKAQILGVNATSVSKIDKDLQLMFYCVRR